MSNDDSLCLPILERIKNLQISEKQSHSLFNDYISSLKSLSSQQLDGESCSNENPSANLNVQKIILNHTEPKCENHNDFFSKNNEICDVLVEHDNEINYMQGSNNLSRIDRKSETVSISKNECTVKSKKTFLKKGQGTARFGMRNLKGFKKKSQTVSHQQCSNEVFHKISTPKDNENKKSNFEKLEELINHESFCSTSSHIENLLKDDSSFSSTPIPMKPTFGLNMELTPITSQSDERNISSSPCTGISVINKVQEGAQQKCMGISGDDTSNFTPTGILKRLTPDRISPVYNVKFRDKGVEVVEFENSILTSDSGTHNDSDFLSASDLQQLALLNCKDKIYQNIWRNFNPNEATGSALSQPRNLHKIDEPNNIVDNGDANKYLLMAKVNDLNKEITIFKTKNKDLDKIIEDVKLEKQELIGRQKENNNKTKTLSSTYVSKLRSLNDRLRKLESENEELKYNIITMEKREKEIKMCRLGMQNYKKKTIKSVCVGENNFSNPSTIDKRKRKSVGDRNVKFSDAKQTQTCEDKHEEGEIFKNVEKVSKMNQELEGVSLNASNDTPLQSTNENYNMNYSEQFVDSRFELPLYSRKSSKTFGNQSPYGTVKIDPFRITQMTNNSDSCSNTSVEIVTIPTSKRKNEFTNEQKNYREALNLSKTVNYKNGNKKIIFEDRIIYCYAKEKVSRTLYKEDEREEIEFANGQREIYFKDGSYQIFLPTGASKSVYNDGTEVSVCDNGSVIKSSDYGTKKTIQFPNGQKEVHENGTISRIYPDGTVKTQFTDGTLETRYHNDLVRIKDKNGNVSSFKKNQR